MTTSTKTFTLSTMTPKLKPSWKVIVSIIGIDPDLSLSINKKKQFKIRVADQDAQCAMAFYGPAAVRAFSMYRVGMTIELHSPIVMASDEKYNVRHCMYVLQDNVRHGRTKILHGYVLPYPMPKLAYMRTHLEHISSKVNCAVDVIACIVSCEDYKSTDSSGYRILNVQDGTSTCTIKLWGDTASAYSYSDVGSIVGFKDLRVVTWEGVICLNSTKFTLCTLTPDSPDTETVKKLVEKVGIKGAGLPSVTNNVDAIMNSSVISIEEAFERTLSSDCNQNFVIRAEIDRVRPPPDQMFYRSCANCNCKVPADGVCLKHSCVGKVVAFTWSKRLVLDVSNLSSECQLNVWNDAVAKVFGVTSTELIRLHTDDRKKLSDLHDELHGKEMIFSIRGKSIYKEADLECTFTVVSCLTVDEYEKSLNDAKHTSPGKNNPSTSVAPIQSALPKPLVLDPPFDLPESQDSSQNPLLSPINFDNTQSFESSNSSLVADDDDGDLFSRNFPSTARLDRGAVTPASRRGKCPARGGSVVPPKTRKVNKPVDGSP